MRPDISPATVAVALTLLAAASAPAQYAVIGTTSTRVGPAHSVR